MDDYQKIIDELDDELPEPEQTEEPPELTDLRDALTLKWPSTVIIAGATDTGKTMLMKNIIYQNALAFNRIYLLSPLADEDVYNFIPKKYRISNPTEADLIQILEEQKKNKHVKTCIICDDCIGKINFANGAISKMITTTGRHYDLSLIIVMQYLNNIAPIIRDNAKYLFVTKLKSHCVDSIYSITSSFSSKAACKRFLDETCRDYRVIRFNLTGYNKEIIVFDNKIPRNFKLNF
jgi:hypothetical protein